MTSLPIAILLRHIATSLQVRIPHSAATTTQQRQSENILEGEKKAWGALKVQGGKILFLILEIVLKYI